MLADYDSRQVVGIDLQRRRRVIVRMTEAGEKLETVRIGDDLVARSLEMVKAGHRPARGVGGHLRLVLGGRCFPGRRRPGASGAPVGVKAFTYRRVKNDVRDATDLADLLRMGRLPEAYVAPPEVRELPELVRHRARLVATGPA